MAAMLKSAYSSKDAHEGGALHFTYAVDPWKASPTAFAQLFLFWSTWRPASNSIYECRHTTWHEALLLYLQFTGAQAFRFGNVTFSQAVYVFKSISTKLLIQCQAFNSSADGTAVRWNPDLPMDATINFACPTLQLSDEMIENLVVLQEFIQKNNATRAYIHAQYDDLIPPEPTCIPFAFLFCFPSQTYEQDTCYVLVAIQI